MGLFDVFKRKQARFTRTRNMEMKFVYECSQCSREKAVCLEISLVENDKCIFMQFVGQSGTPILKKLPAALISVNEHGNYSAPVILDDLASGKSAPISSKTLKEAEFAFVCPYCGGKAYFVLAVGIIINAKGNFILQKDRDIPEVYGTPVVLLRSDAHGNFNVVTFLNPALELTKDIETVELDLESAKDYNKRGIDYYIKQQYNLAIANFTKAIELDPSFCGAYHNRGLAFRDSGQYASAILDFNKAIEVSPSTVAYFNRGLAYSDIGRYDLSIDDFSKAIQLDHTFARAYYERACAYIHKGSYDLGLADFNRVIEMSDDPELIQLTRQAIKDLPNK